MISYFLYIFLFVSQISLTQGEVKIKIFLVWVADPNRKVVNFKVSESFRKK